MIESEIFKQVEAMAQSTGSVLGLLVGYAKLLGMNEGVLGSLFQGELQQDLAMVRQVMEEKNIDVDLIRKCSVFITDKENNEDEQRELKEVLQKYEDHDGTVLASDILRDMLKMNIPEMEILKKGHTLDDVISYLSSTRPAPKPQQKPAKKPEKPAAEKPAEEEGKPRTLGGSDASEEAEAQQQETAPESAAAAAETAAQADSSVTQAEKFQVLVQKTTQLYERLKYYVKGQDEAIRLFASGYFQSEVLREEETDRKGPSSTFLFAGPPGVGKTHLAKSAAKILGMPFKVFNMSEYADGHTSVGRLTGIGPDYQGKQPGLLTKFVKENPRSIILFDEIEKAHIEVIYQFLQVLDGGTLTDTFTREVVDFSDTILIFTTNVGKSLYEDRDRTNLSSLPRNVVIKALEEEKGPHGDAAIPGAIVSRFASGNLLMFNFLEVHTLVEIINQNINTTLDMIRKIYDIEVKVDDKLAPMLLYAQSNQADARNVSAQSIILLKNELYEFGRHAQASLTGLKKLTLRVDVEKENEAIYPLFYNEEGSKLLYIGNREDVESLPLGDNCERFYAENRKEAMEILSKEEISFVLLDLYCGSEAVERKFLSLDDWQSEGVLAFDEIIEKMPEMPIYIADKHEIGAEEQAKFLERGARAFISYQPKDKVDFADRIAWIADMIYMQKKVDELSGRSRVLTYNTAQRFLEDGESAEIVFYDFRIRVASSSDENQMMVSDNERPKERFADVIGAKNAKEELETFVRYMQNPKRYMKKSARPPKGILFYGPPGTGKTMLARAMAGECNASFFPTTAANFARPYVGTGEAYIRELFATAKKFAPSIIFIDEIDAVGKERTGSHATAITEQYLNTLLTEMDGFEVNLQRPVFVIAATNYDLEGSGRKAALDPALLRRFDNRILVDLPNEDERKEFLNLKIGKIEEHEITEEAVRSIASRTTGESLAILQNVLNLALRNAEKKDETLNDRILLDALEEYMYGEKREWDEEYYKSVSIHESGHAYICSLAGEHPSFVTIVSRGDFGGYMQHENQEKNPSYTREQLIWRVRTALAGRAAELEFFGEKEGVNTGISSDLSSATSIIMNFICRYAMAGDHMLSLSPDQLLSTKLGEKILIQAEKMMEEQMEVTRQLVHEGRDKIQALADFLLKNNQATEDQIADLLGFERRKKDEKKDEKKD